MIQAKRRPEYSAASGLLIAILLVLWGCEGVNPGGPVPSYVYIDTFALTVEPGYGSASEKISEGWFYANNEFLGAYTLPAAVPVIAEGPTEILVFPGIRANGVSTLPDIYPFYQRYEADVSLTLTDTVFLAPTTTYLPSSLVAINEDFETSNTFVDEVDGDTETKLVLTTEGVFEGERSGYIELNADHPVIEVANLPIHQGIPINGTSVYLEINYRNNTELGVGLIGHGPGIPAAKQIFVILREREDWNKVYIDLTAQVNASRLPGYQILFTAFHNPAVEVSEVFLDNVKLVYFKP